LARALASGSDLLFLDEPLSSLDAKVRTELRYEIRNLVRDLELTAIHITHDQEEAMSVADRVAVMKGGRLIEIRPPNELYAKPESLFVANFVGEANFLEGTVVKASRDSCFVDSQGLLLESTDASEKEGEKVIIAIRPELVSMDKNLGPTEGFEGHIETQDFEGSTVRYGVILAQHEPFVVRLPQVSGITAFNVGDEVLLRVLPRNVLVYPYPKLGLQKELSLE
jgi:putative spermidine/putrescine transport system ATP-binding protein